MNRFDEKVAELLEDRKQRQLARLLKKKAWEADQQRQLERAHAMFTMYKNGEVSMRYVGEQFGGISRARVQQILKRYMKIKAGLEAKNKGEEVVH